MALVGWTTANFLSLELDEPEHIFLAIKAVFFFVILQNFAFYFFSKIFPASEGRIYQRLDRLYIITTVLLAVSALAGVFFAGYTYENDKFSLIPSPFIALFIGHAGLSIGWGLKKLTSRYLSSKGVLKNQLLFLLGASSLLLVLVPITNFILPVAFKNNLFVAVSPLYTLAFTSIIAYAIIRQKLFDIRLIVATSVAYVLSLATLGIVYGTCIYLLSQLVFGISTPQSTLQQISNIALVVLLAFTFQPIKNFFNRLTNSIFYRDAYDDQVVLDKINTLLTEQMSLKPIIETSLRLICENLKISHGQLVVVEKGKIYRAGAYGRSPADIDPAELHVFRREVSLLEDLHQTAASQILEKYNFEVCLKMTTKNGVVGYIFLSTKRSGNIFTNQDLRLLSIISDSLSIAVENARAVEEIERFNVTLQQKIDDATLKLKHANTRLKELDEAKDEFVSMASHQLRTPLTVIKGYLSMLLEGDMGKVTKQQKDVLQSAFDGSERMVFLIGDLLNVSRLQTGKFQIENQLTDLNALIDHEIKHLQESAANHQLKLTFESPKDFPKLMLDETKIRQVVMNFIDNAIYYTPPGGSINVKLEADDKQIRCTVNDTGLGVPKSEQHHLFSKFYRAGNARKMRPDGTGLGLYMAKKIIVAQGGAIIFQSTEGKGSTFGFSLPRSAVEQK